MKNEKWFEEAVDMYLKEMPINMISEKIGVSAYKISTNFKKNNIEIRKGFNPNIEKYIEGMELYKDGKSICQISKELSINRNRFSQYLKRQGIQVTRKPHKYSINSNIFEVIDTEEKAYWLGFLYADGCMWSSRKSIELGLAEVDKSHIYKFRKFLSSTHKISKKINNSKVSYRIIVQDSNIYDNLINLGCVPRKSLILEFPKSELIPSHLIPHFVRGYFDGDGGICITEKTLCVNILGTKEFLNGLKTNVPILNNKSIFPVDYKQKDKNNFRIQISGKEDIKNLLCYMYDNSSISLDRKFEKYKEFICRAT